MFRRFVEIGAWAEGSRGADFLDGPGPEPEKAVVAHTRNNGLHDLAGRRPGESGN